MRSNYCDEDILCSVCSEHTTRHDPCCPGGEQCDCEEEEMEER